MKVSRCRTAMSIKIIIIITTFICIPDESEQLELEFDSMKATSDNHF